MNRLGFTVDKVVHHDDVLFLRIIRSRRNVAACNSHVSDTRVGQHDAEERKTCIAGGCWYVAAEQQLTAGAVVLDQCARVSVSSFSCRTAAVGLVHIREDRAETSDRSRYVAAAGHEKVDFRNLASDCAEQSRIAEGLESGGVRRIVEQTGQTSGREQGWIGADWSLNETCTVWSCEQGAACYEKTWKRIARDRGG